MNEGIQKKAETVVSPYCLWLFPYLQLIILLFLGKFARVFPSQSSTLTADYRKGLNIYTTKWL